MKRLSYRERKEITIRDAITILDVLYSLAAEKEKFTLDDIRERHITNKYTTRDVINVLIEMGYIERIGRGQYKLTKKLKLPILRTKMRTLHDIINIISKQMEQYKGLDRFQIWKALNEIECNVSKIRDEVIDEMVGDA